MENVNKGTDTDALGSFWFSAELDIEQGQTVKKVEAICGDIIVSVTNPVSPVEFNLTKEQSRQLKCGENLVHLYGYDENGKRFKFDGAYRFIASPEG